MQASDLDQKNNKLSGDVECINFRPSPNFKHMRKYLKAHSSPNQNSDSRSTSPLNSEKQDQMNREMDVQQPSTSGTAQPVQPPLPPNFPPPELVVPKQEVEDEEYNDRTVQPEQKTGSGEPAKKEPEKTMCRQFVRGTCTRGTACIYVHELVLSQLPGVYTFCKNFQNSICKYPMCKFVHATVFEKEHFYRTGFLPPHTLKHLKDSNSALGPPAALEATTADAIPAFMNPPPAMLPGMSSLPTSGSSPPDALPMSELFGPPVSAPIKFGPNRDVALAWHNTEAGEPNKCKTCEITRRRIRTCMKQHDETMETQESLHKQKMKLMRQETRINNVLESLLKQKNGNLNLSSGVSQRNDIEIETMLANHVLQALKKRENIPRI